MENPLQDLRFGARLLRLNPGFAAVAVLSLALGVGANTAIFQLLDAVRLRSLPVKDPQQLAVVRLSNVKGRTGRFHGRYSMLTNSLWEQIRDHQQVFSHVTAWGGEQLNLSVGGEVRYAQAIWVSGDYFQTLEVQPMIGRVFLPEDDRRGCAASGAVITFAFWQREFGGDPQILGRKLTLEGHPFEVIGVTPPDFYGVDVGRRFDVAIPLCTEPVIHGEEALLDMRHGWWLAAFGRLKPGTTLAQATAQLNAVAPSIMQATLPPAYNPDLAKTYLAYGLEAADASTGFSSLRRRFENPLWMLLAIAGSVLLIACANLANLMLARASVREREIAVRLALGASRARLIRQLLAESLLLAVLGAAAGAALAQGLTRLLISFLDTQSSPLFVDLALDWRVFGFTVGLAALTCILFGLVPALRATQTAPAMALRATGRSFTASRERFGLRRALIVSQVALSLVLVVGSMLFVRTLRNLLRADPGFRPEGVLVAELDLTRLNLKPEIRQAYKRDLLERIRAVPGVDSAADTSIVPISGNGWNENVFIDGSTDHKGLANFSRVTPGYFQMMRMPLLAGRDFDERDTAASPKVAVVNEAFVRKLLNGASPVGRRFKIEEYVGRPTPMYEIVGLVKDTKYYELREDFDPIVFVPAAQDDRPDTSAQFLVRSSIPMSGLLSSVKQAFADANPEINFEFRVMGTDIRNSILRERLMAMLSGFFGFLAALLATIGLYGVISYSVARRTTEIGVRMALGAQRSNIVAMVLREAGLLVGIGLVLGAGISLAVAKTASSLLYGLKPRDPLTLAAAILAFAAVAALASFLPAFRASRLDPMVALRDE